MPKSANFSPEQAEIKTKTTKISEIPENPPPLGKEIQEITNPNQNSVLYQPKYRTSNTKKQKVPTAITQKAASPTPEQTRNKTKTPNTKFRKAHPLDKENSQN